MITLFGATGYTGQRIALVLDREGLPYRLAGRSPDKLADLSNRLSARPDWLTADARQPGSLPRLFQESRVLINCAGPFTDLGEKVITQVAMSGTHYLDTTNELGFVLRARSYNQMAARTHTALLPACGFEVALSDCAAAMIAEKFLSENNGETIDHIDIVYVLDGIGASAGTRRSAVRSLATSWVAYREGNWTGQIPGSRVRRFDLPNSARHALLIPSSESVTLPLHLPINRVDVWMAISSTLRFGAPVLIPLLARMSRSILRPVILKLAGFGALPAGGISNGGIQAGSPFTIYVSVHQGRHSRWMVLSGKDPYGLTAEIIVYAARMLSANFQKAGLLAPAQALDPQAFLDHAVRNWGLSIREGIEPG